VAACCCSDSGYLSGLAQSPFAAALKQPSCPLPPSLCPATHSWTSSARRSFLPLSSFLRSHLFSIHDMFLRLILARFGIHPNANAHGQINVQTGDAQDGGGGNCPCAASLAVPGNLQQDNADLAAAAEGVPLSLHAAAPLSTWYVSMGLLSI
jgi:hypothetical protein